MTLSSQMPKSIDFYKVLVCKAQDKVRCCRGLLQYAPAHGNTSMQFVVHIVCNCPGGGGENKYF